MHTTTTMSGEVDDPPSEGYFDGVAVRHGRGGGLSSLAPGMRGASTHFRAARPAGFGDVVLAVTRVFDERTSAPTRMELRAFSASAPRRTELASLDPHELYQSPGAIAFAALELSATGDAPDERRPATLIRCVVTDAAPTPQAARRVAEWLRATWETELCFGSWPAVRGSIAAFSAPGGGEVADWARTWLEESEHRVWEAEGDTRFLKVLSDTWIQRPKPGAGAGTEDEAASSHQSPDAAGRER